MQAGLHLQASTPVLRSDLNGKYSPGTKYVADLRGKAGNERKRFFLELEKQIAVYCDPGSRVEGKEWRSKCLDELQAQSNSLPGLWWYLISQVTSLKSKDMVAASLPPSRCHPECLRDTQEFRGMWGRRFRGSYFQGRCIAV